MEDSTEDDVRPDAEPEQPQVDDSPEPVPDPAAPAPTRWRSFLDHLPFGLVLLVGFVGMLLIVDYHWRWGSALLGSALMLAAALRAILPPDRAGLIAVRGKPIDVLCYAGLSLCVLFVAYTLQGNLPG